MARVLRRCVWRFWRVVYSEDCGVEGGGRGWGGRRGVVLGWLWTEGWEGSSRGLSLLGLSSLVGEGEAFVCVSVLGFNGVLKGDLKGWESVWDASSIRRRFVG